MQKYYCLLNILKSKNQNNERFLNQFVVPRFHVKSGLSLSLSGRLAPLPIGALSRLLIPTKQENHQGNDST